MNIVSGLPEIYRDHPGSGFIVLIEKKNKKSSGLSLQILRYGEMWRKLGDELMKLQ